MTRQTHLFRSVFLSGILALFIASCAHNRPGKPSPALSAASFQPTLDLREPMALAAGAIPPRLDHNASDRPWFLLRGHNGIPTEPVHDMWDIGDMTGRYLESLILARRMGIISPEMSQAEWRLEKSLFNSIGTDGLVHEPSGAVVHSFSQGSALYGLLAWFEDTHDPQVRAAIERLISAQLQRAQRKGNQLSDPTVQLEKASGSHLAGYQIYPVIRFYELTGYADALRLAEGLTAWAMADPVLGDDGEIKLALSWEGHIHSWLETLAGCARTARHSSSLDRAKIIAKSRAVYDWVQRSNGTSFGWIATFPTHGSSETCAISSAIRLALELSATGCPEYLDDIERFVRNQVVEAQFRDLKDYTDGTNRPTALLLGCFDSQSAPNGHLGTRGGEDVGNVEGCCLNGGMRALALAWDAVQVADEHGLTVQLGLTRNGPAGNVIGYQPFEGRVDVIPRTPGALRVRVPRWVKPETISVLVDGQAATWTCERSFVVLSRVRGGQRVSVRYPLRELEEDVSVAGKKYHVCWKGDVVTKMDPPGQREPCYQSRAIGAKQEAKGAPPENQRHGRQNLSSAVPDTYVLQDAARLATCSMLARIDLERGGQPFFCIYPFADPPRAEHGKWDDGDMSGRYVEALILARQMTGIPIDSRELLLRSYLARLFDPKDGLCYTQGAEWTPRRACLFSQSSAMLGLLAWHRETGSPQARKLLDQQVKGLMRLAVDRGNYAYFPKYEWDGKKWVDDPPGKDAPPWYGGRLIVPLVKYWDLRRGETKAGPTSTGQNNDDSCAPTAREVQAFLEKLVRYPVEVSHFIKPDGEVEQGEGWWGHLHSTMDMAAGVAEYGRLAGRPELVAWARRIYEWVGRTQTTRCGWVADVSGGHICESCAIASRIRLGLALYRAGAADPFGEIDRCLRNQLLENQFVDLDFFPPQKPETPRTAQKVYDGVDRMIRGTFQCWATANDLIGADDIEGCGAGGGVQAMAMAWNSQAEWRETARGKELRVHLLFNRRLRAPAEALFTSAAPVAAELWSYLPSEGRVRVAPHQKIDRLALRLPDGADLASAKVRRGSMCNTPSSTKVEGQYAGIENLVPGEIIELEFALKQYQTTERAAGVDYNVEWKGSAVANLTPHSSNKCPLYGNRSKVLNEHAPLCAPRYP